MTKIELVRAISKNTGIDVPTVATCVESMCDVISKSLAEKEPVFMRGFGTFGLKHRAQKTARNICANTSVIVEAHDIPFFKACPDLMDAVAAK